jgi:hypothetical protein
MDRLSIPERIEPTTALNDGTSRNSDNHRRRGEKRRSPDETPDPFVLESSDAHEVDELA